MEENSNKKSFNKGIVMALFGWFLTIITTPIIASLMTESIDFVSLLDQLLSGFIVFYGGVLLIIWGPAAWIIAKAYRKKGFRKALSLTISIYAISMLVFFGCSNLIR